MSCEMKNNIRSEIKEIKRTKIKNRILLYGLKVIEC